MLKESLLKLFKLDNLVSNLTGYIETRVELMKEEVKEELAKAVAKLSLMLILIATFTLFIVFISVTLALFIAKYTGTIWGFAIVAGLYLLIALVLLLAWPSMSASLEKKLIDQLRKK